MSIDEESLISDLQAQIERLQEAVRWKTFEEALPEKLAWIIVTPNGLNLPSIAALVGGDLIRCDGRNFSVEKCKEEGWRWIYSPAVPKEIAWRQPNPRRC